MPEIWKNVVGFDGYLGADLLEISDGGNVRHTVTKQPVVLKQDTKGYFRVLFAKGGHSEAVHRLVLFAFEGPPESSRYKCCWWDGDVRNNSITNLRWGTNADSADDKRRLTQHVTPPKKSTYVKKKKPSKHARFDLWLAGYLKRKVLSKRPL